MTGGGARAAYQVGVLKAIAELLPQGTHNPFPIICGTSAGAINAAALATHAQDYRYAVQRLETIWANFHANQIFRTDVLGILKTGVNWLLAIMSIGISRRSTSLYLLDRTPLRALLDNHVRSHDIQNAIDKGYLHALCITASGYTSHQSVSFFHGHPSLLAWQRFRRCGAKVTINVDHLMASSAIPFIFAPQKINREHFGDGSMRQLTPISPALHLGAEAVLVIGNSMQPAEVLPRIQEQSEPSIGEIAGHVLDSIFLDSLDADIERLERINRTIKLIPADNTPENTSKLRHIEVLVIAPSEDMQVIASQYAHELPIGMRLLLKGIGASKNNSSNLISYLLFEQSYTRKLIELGYQDAMRQKEDIQSFLSSNSL